MTPKGLVYPLISSSDDGLLKNTPLTKTGEAELRFRHRMSKENDKGRAKNESHVG